MWIFSKKLPVRAHCRLTNEWEIVREPGVDAAFERADPGDSFGSQQ